MAVPVFGTGRPVSFRCCCKLNIVVICVSGSDPLQNKLVNKLQVKNLLMVMEIPILVEMSFSSAYDF